MPVTRNSNGPDGRGHPTVEDVDSRLMPLGEFIARGWVIIDEQRAIEAAVREQRRLRRQGRVA